MSRACHGNASNIRDSSVCYDEYNNEDLLHLNKKIKINKNDFYKNPKNGYKEHNCYEPLNSYDIFPHGGLYYYDIIIKDILKYGFNNKNIALKYKKQNENCDNENYVYLGAGVLKKEQKNKKHRDKNKMVFIFFVNEVLLKRLRSKERKQIRWKERERHKRKKKNLESTCSPENNENNIYCFEIPNKKNENKDDNNNNIKNDQYHNIPNGDIIYNPAPIKEDDAKYQDKNIDGIFVKRKRKKRSNNRLNDITYILNEKIRNKNTFVKTKSSLFCEYTYLNEAGVCTDVNRNQKSINFESFYNDPKIIGGNTTPLTTSGYCKKDKTLKRCTDYSDSNDYSDISDSSDCGDSSYSSNCSDESSFYDDLMDRGEEVSAPNVYTDKNNIFLLNILHHQNTVYSVKWKEGISENVSILVSICYDGYMYIWKEQTNCENKITFVSICRIYILYFEKIVSNIKWCWVKKENEYDYYNFIMNNVTTFNGNSSNKMNITKNEYLIVYGCKNKSFKRANLDITPYKMKNKIKNCIYFSEFENTSDEKDFMIFSVYAIFNIYNNNIYIKNILNYENVPININFNYIINAKIEYNLLNTSLISIYTDDTYIPNNEYNIKYGEWKVKRVCDYLNNFLLNKNNSRNYFNQLKKSYISNFINLSSCSDSSCSSFDQNYNDEKNNRRNSRYSIHNLNNNPNKQGNRNINYESNTSSTRTSEKIKERNFIFLQKLLNVVNNLMPPFSLKISTKNSDFYKIIIKPNDIWIKKKKSIGVRYILDYKNCECSKSYANKYFFLNKGKKNMNSQLFYNIDFNNNQNVLIMVNKLNCKLYLYDFSTCIKLKQCTNFDEYPCQEIQNIKIDEGIENDKFTDTSIKSYINNRDVSNNMIRDVNHENNNDEKKSKRKAPKKFSLICCLNSIYIDKYYILKYKIYNFLKLKTHFIYSYSNKICNYYEHLKENKKNTISAKEFLEKKMLIPLVYKSKMIENLDSFFLLMCIDKNRENIFVLKSEKINIVQNLKMICIFDENKCEEISNSQNKAMHFNMLNERKSDTKCDINNNYDGDNTMENNIYLNKVKQDIAQVEKGSFKITDYMIKDFHITSKNDEKEILLTIKYTYTTNDYDHSDSKKKKKNAYLLIISTLQICKDNFIYINLKLRNMFTFFSPINANFLFSYFYLSYQNVYIIATNHTEASHTYNHDILQNNSDNKNFNKQRNNYFIDYYGKHDEINNKKKHSTLNNNIDNSENVSKNRSSIFYENNYDIFKMEEENSLFSFERRKMQTVKNGHIVLVNFDDTDGNNNFGEEHIENKKKQQTENNDHVNYKINKNYQNKKYVVNFYLIYPNNELIINFFQIQNITNIVQICLYDNFVSLITHKKLHIFNFNNICNNLISDEVRFCESINYNKRKGIDIISLSFPKILRNKIKSKIFMTCSGEKDVYFIVASFLVNIKKINKGINNTYLHTQQIEEKGNYYYASVILFNNIMNKNKWNILKYKNSYLIFSRNIYFLENNLLFLKKLSSEYEQTVVNRGILVEDETEKEAIESCKDKIINEKSKHHFLVDNDENSHINSHGNSLSFQKINLFRNFKKYNKSKMNSQLKRKKTQRKKSYRMFYHPIKLLNYIKMGLFSHVNVALKLLLYILLNKLFKNKNKYHIKKACSLHYIFDEKKKMEVYTNLFEDIACVKKCQFLFDLNVIHVEIEKLYKNNEKKYSCISMGEMNIDENKLMKENEKAKKEDNDKSIFFWDNDAVSLDDFNLYSDDSNLEKEKKKNSEGSNNEDNSSSSKNKKNILKKKDDNTFSSDEWEDDEETKNEFSKKEHGEYEKEEINFKNYLKYSNVLNLQLKIEEIKMLQILILHMNIPHLNDFFQLLLFCILNSFYYALECETKPIDDKDYNNSDMDSDNSNSQSSYKSDKKNKSECHCEMFNFNIKKEIIKTDHFYIFNYINDNKETDISSSLNNFAQVVSFFSRLYINCYFLLNIQIDIHYSYCYFLYFINQMVGKNIYKYLESFITNYKCFFIMNVTKNDLLSVDLFNPISISEEINRRMEERKRKIKADNTYYNHMGRGRSVINNSSQSTKIQSCIDIHNDVEDSFDNNLIKKVKIKKNDVKRVGFKASDRNDEESRENAKVFEVILNNIEITKREFFESETDNILKYSLFNLFKDMNIFYYMHNKEMLFFIHDVLVNRVIKKINTINIDDKEKNNEFNECMDFLALLYLAKNEKQKLMVFYKIKKQNKIYDFLSNDFKIQKWINALLNNAYKLMQIKRYYLAIAFFILLGDVKDIVDVIHQYLRDTQLAIFIIRLIYFSYCETDEIYNNAIGCINNEHEMFKYNPILSKNTGSQSNEQIASLSLQQNEDNENSDISSNVSLRSISIANESISNFGGSIQDGKNIEILSNSKENNNKTVKDSENFENSIANFLPKYLNYIFQVKLFREKKNEFDMCGYTSIDSESSCSVYKNEYYYELNKNKNVNNKNVYFNIIKFIILEKYEDAYAECEKRKTNDFMHIMIKNVIKNKLFKKDAKNSDKQNQNINNQIKNSDDVSNNFNVKLDLAEFYFCSQDFLKKNMYNLSFIFYFVFFYNTMKEEAQLWNIPNEIKTEHLISSNNLFQFFKQHNPLFVILFEIYIERYIIKNRNIFSMLFFSTIYKQMCYNILLYDNFYQSEKKKIYNNDTDNICVNFLSHIKLLSKLIYSIYFRIYNNKIQNENYLNNIHQSGGIYNSEENVTHGGCFFLNYNGSSFNGDSKFKGISEMHRRHPSYSALLNNEDINLFKNLNTPNNIMGKYDLYYGNSLEWENESENKSIVIPFIKKIKNIEYVDSFGKRQNIHIFLNNFFNKLTYLCNKDSKYVINSFILYDNFCNEEKKENNWCIEEYHISLNKYNNILNNFFTYIFYLYIINEKKKSDVMIFIINNITSIFFIYINDIVSIIFNFLKKKKKSLLYLHVPFLQLIFLRIILSNYFVYEKRQDKMAKKRNRNNLKIEGYSNISKSNTKLEKSENYGKRMNESNLKVKMESSKCHNTYNAQENIFFSKKNISDINKMGIKINEKYFFYYIHLIDLFICYISVMVICIIMLKKYYRFFENVGVEIDKENSMRFDGKANKINKEDIYGHNKRQTLKRLFGILHLFLKKIKKMNWDVENVYKRKTSITTALLKFIKKIYLCKKKINNKIRCIYKGNNKTKQPSGVEKCLSEEAQFFYKYNNECTNELIENIEKNVTKKGSIVSNSEKGIKNDSKMVESEKMNNENILQNKNLDGFVNGMDHQSSIKSCGYLQKVDKYSFSEVLFERFCITNIFLSIFELLMSNFQIFAYKSNIFTWTIHLKKEWELKKTKRKRIIDHLSPINKTKISYIGNKLDNNINNQTKSNLKYANFVSINYNGANNYIHIFYYKTCIMLGVLENISNFINKYFFPKLKLLLYKSAYNVKNTLLTFLSFPFFINKIKTKTHFITCEHFIDSHISYYYNKELYFIWKLNNCTYRTFILFFNKYFYSYNNYMNDQIHSYKDKLLMNITKNNLKLDITPNGICDNVENKDDIFCENNLKKNELSYNMYEQNLTQKYNQQIENEKNVFINCKVNNPHDEQVNDLYEYSYRENQYNYNYKKFYDLYNNGFRICEKNYLIFPNVNMEKNGAAYNRSNFLFKKSKSQDKLFTFTSRMNFFKKFRKNTKEREYLIKEENQKNINQNYMASNSTNMSPSGTHVTSNDTSNEESKLIMEKENESEEAMDKIVKKNRYLYIQKNNIQENYAIHINDNSKICTNEQSYSHSETKENGVSSFDFHLQNSKQTEQNPQISNIIEVKNKHKHRKRHNKIPHTIPLSLLFNKINERHVIEKDKISNSSSTIVYIRRKNKLKKISILDHLKKLNKKCQFINYILYSDLHHGYQNGSRGTRVNVDEASIAKVGHNANNLNDRKNNIMTNVQNNKYVDMIKSKQGVINKTDIINGNNELIKLSRSVENKSINVNQSQLDCVQSNDMYEEKENKKKVKHDDIYININMSKLLYIYKCMHIQCMHNLTPLCSLLNNYIPNDCSITNFFSNSYNNFFVNNIFFHNFFYTYDNNLVLLLNSGNIDPVRYTCTEFEEYENRNDCKTSGIPLFLNRDNKNQMLEKDTHQNLCQVYKDNENHTQINNQSIFRRNKCDENIFPFCNTKELNEKLINNIHKYQPEYEMKKNFTISKTAEKYIEKILLLLYNNVDLNERDKINGNNKHVYNKTGDEGKKEFDNLFEYIDKNLNNCLRKKYNFIYNITDQKNNLSYLKTGAIISHPFLPVYALVHINNEKKINTDNELDKYKFKIRLCKFTNKSDDISYKYGDIITSILWNTNGNLLIISDDQGYLYIYNIFLGNFIQQKKKKKLHNNQGDITGTNTNIDNNMNSLSYSVNNRKQDIVKNISKSKKSNSNKHCNKNEACQDKQTNYYDKETDGNEEYFHYDNEEDDENNGEDNEYEWIEQYREDIDEEEEFYGTEEYDDVDEIEKDGELGEFDEHVKQAKNIESEQRKNDNKYNFTSSEAKNSKKKKSDDTSFGSKIKGNNNKIKNFFKDNFLKKNKNKNPLEISEKNCGVKISEKNQDGKKKKKKNIYIHKKGYIIKEAMCIVKLHDEIIDVKCLDDNNFYLITIGKGINTKCINNHTAYINSNYVQDEYNKNNLISPKETRNVENINSQDNFSKTNLEKDKNTTFYRNLNNTKGIHQITVSHHFHINNNIHTDQQNEIGYEYNNSYICNDTYTTSSKQDGPSFNMIKKYGDFEKWNKSNSKESCFDQCYDNTNGNNLHFKKKKKNYKEIERKSANNIDTFLNLHVFKKKHSYFKSRFFYFDSPNIVFFNKHKKLKNILQENLCICVWDLCSMLTNEQKIYLLNKQNMSIDENRNVHDIGGNGVSNNISFEVEADISKDNNINKEKNKKLQKIILHPTLICIISNISKYKNQINKNKNSENENFITSFCSWIRPNNYMHKIENPFEKEQNEKIKKQQKRVQKNYYSDQIVKSSKIPNQSSPNDFPNSSIVRSIKQNKNSKIIIKSKKTNKQKKSIFWNFFKNKIYSNNFSGDSYIFYGDQMGYIHIIHLQKYKEILCFKAFDIPIFKIFITKTDVITKLLILADIKLRIYEIVTPREICFIKEVEINHELCPKKCICEENLNELKEKRKTEENENEGMSIFNLSYFLSSNYHKKNNTKSEEKANLINNISKNKINFENPNILNETLSTFDNITQTKNKTNTNISKESYNNIKKNNTIYKNSISNSSFGSIHNFKNMSESDDDENNNKDSYQSVIIGGINFGYLGLNFSKFINNKKNKKIIDAYLLTNSHLVTISSNGTIILIKI
ncbi:conserved Plasmodium protein, unknown function [Plasmodium berghei]|uniref:RAVE complex protein Rav1 C-terminal domain-containing protein n=1 Tax=Plasmodium berghei TaxID=5821 RepID=A0A1D3SJL6_PLABE|nr:conserved Plasmodium protein, unknown function [Plasmodium berghei]